MELTAVLHCNRREAVRAAIDEGTERTVEALIGTNERLRGELTGRARPPERRQPHCSSRSPPRASGNLGAVEDGLAGRVQHIEAPPLRDRHPDGPRLRPGGRSGRRAAQRLLRRHPAGDWNSPTASRSAAARSPIAPASRCSTLTEAAAALERVEARMNEALCRPPGGPGRASRPHQRALAGSRIRHPLLHDPPRKAPSRTRKPRRARSAPSWPHAAETTTQRHRRAVRAHPRHHRRGKRADGSGPAHRLRAGRSRDDRGPRQRHHEVPRHHGRAARHDRPDPARAGSHPGRTAPRRRRAAAGDPGDDGQHAPRRRRPDQGSERALGSGLPLEPRGRRGSGRPAPQGAVNETPVAATMAAVAAAVEQRIAQTPAPAPAPAVARQAEPKPAPAPAPVPGARRRHRRLFARPRRPRSVRLAAGRKRLPAKPAPAAAGCRTS